MNRHTIRIYRCDFCKVHIVISQENNFLHWGIKNLFCYEIIESIRKNTDIGFKQRKRLFDSVVFQR